MKTIALLAILSLTSTSYAADVALNCSRKSSSSDLSAQILVLADSQIQVLEEISFTNFYGEKIVNKKDFTLSLLGKSDLKMKFGILKDKDPVVNFVNVSNPGQSYLNLPTSINDSSSITLTYVVDRSSRDVACEKGPAYDQFEKLVSSATLKASEDVKAYWDSNYAMKCSDSNSQSYSLRAFNTFADSSVQIYKDDNRWISLEESGASDSEVVYTDKYQNSSVQLKVSLVPRPQDAASYTVTLTEGPQQTQLICEAKWAFQNILKSVEQKKTLATSFPTKPGTLVDVDRSLCMNGPAYTDVLNRYSKLIFTVKDVNGFALGKYEKSKSPIGQECLSISIMTKTDEALAAIKAIVGDSLEGRLVDYQKIGRIVLQ